MKHTLEANSPQCDVRSEGGRVVVDIHLLNAVGVGVGVVGSGVVADECGVASLAESRARSSSLSPRSAFTNHTHDGRAIHQH